MAPGDETLADEECRGGGEEEGAAALCGDGETHQVGDRPRSDRSRPEPPHVGVVGWEPGGVVLPDDRSDPAAAGGGCASGVFGVNGDARMWRGYPGTGGRTSTVSGIWSGRRRDVG